MFLSWAFDGYGGKHSLSQILNTLLIERKNSILLTSDMPLQAYNFNNEEVLENII